jgi:hypothetical protein
MMLTAHIPHEPFNSLVRDGSAGKQLQEIVAATKPEAVYFTEQNGLRCAVLIVNVDSASAVPALVEPWFLKFEADCEVRIVMTPEDLAKAGLESLGAKWK